MVVLTTQVVVEVVTLLVLDLTALHQVDMVPTVGNSTQVVSEVTDQVVH